MTIEERQQELIDSFSMMGEWMEKYEFIIELGQELPSMKDEWKTEDNLIRGCQSKVWLVAEKNNDGTLHFTADSDAIITKGLVSMVVSVFQDKTGKEIVDAPVHFLTEMGLMDNLSPTRSNGVASMIKQIKTYGLVLS
jgi:cysteine desulfuration protein SufE